MKVELLKQKEIFESLQESSNEFINGVSNSKQVQVNDILSSLRDTLNELVSNLFIQ